MKQATFTVTYNNIRNEIEMTNNLANVNLKIITPTDLLTRLSGTWNGAFYGVSNPSDMNETFRNMDGVSPTYTFQEFYRTCYLNLHPVRNIYSSSPDIGNFNTVGSNGERNIVEKIPVIANPGELIFDKITSSSDYLDCSRQILRAIQFQLKDVVGNVIDLHKATI
jgi:hypothetical protein